MNFGEVLKSCIDSQEDSVRHFSESTGINRGWVYNIFNGKKSLPEDKFQDILSSYPFSEQSRRRLREAYYREVYGDPAYERIQYIIDRINQLADDTPRRDMNIKYSALSDLPASLATLNRLHDAVVSLIRTAAKAGDSWCYTNFPYSQTDIDSLFFSCVRGTDIKLFHMTDIRTDEACTETLDTIFSSVKYAREGINTYYSLTGNVPKQRYLVTYPWFFVTNAGTLLYDYDSIEGVLLTDPQTTAAFRRMAEGLFSHTTPLIHFFKDIFEYKNLITLRDSGGEAFSYEYYPCISTLLDQDIVKSIIADKTQLPYIVPVVSDWLEKWGDPAKVQFFHIKNGLEEFARNGRYYSPDLATAFPVTDRIKVLSKFLDLSKTYHSVFLMDEQYLQCPKDIIIDIYTDLTHISGQLECHRDIAYVGDWAIIMSDPVITTEFTNFKDYIMRNRFYCSYEFTNHFISDLIFKLEVEAGITLETADKTLKSSTKWEDSKNITDTAD